MRFVTPQKVKEFFAYEEGDEFTTKVYSQEGEDILLKRIFDHSPAGFYVDVGAHHPFRFSNTKLLYDKGWRGINIEPNPDVRNLFQKFRPRDIFINCGISETGGTLEYFQFSHPALNTFDSRVAHSRKKDLLNTLNIPTLPLRDVLHEHLPRNTKISLLTIDVEGFDLQVLNSINWSTTKPIYIFIEDLERTLNSGPSHTLLVSKGYRLISVLLNSKLYYYELA